MHMDAVHHGLCVTLHGASEFMVRCRKYADVTSTRHLALFFLIVIVERDRKVRGEREGMACKQRAGAGFQPGAWR